MNQENSFHNEPMRDGVFDFLDPDINHFNENNFNNNSYKNLDQFLKDNSYSGNDFSILNFNIRSYFKNFDEFSSLFMNNKFTHDVIVLTETWVRHALLNYVISLDMLVIIVFVNYEMGVEFQFSLKAQLFQSLLA